jgi:hypothetical protein
MGLWKARFEDFFCVVTCVFVYVVNVNSAYEYVKKMTVIICTGNYN